MKKWHTIFSKEMIKQFRKLATKKDLKETLRSLLDELEEKGPQIGELLDSRVHLYELKQGNPSIRIYYRPRENSNKIDVFEYEIKKRPKQQKQTINRIRRRLSET